MHCVDPECIKICPEEAISKNSNGIVLVDQELCSGCRLCFDACPVNVPQFGKNNKMQKCNFCIHVIEKGYNPVCVDTCPGGAIGFEIVDKPPQHQSLSGLASTFSSVIFGLDDK